jgi:hypothetical protein
VSKNWIHKDIWTRREKSFCVQVSRHEVSSYPFEELGPNRWCIYAYIYPSHSYFLKFKGTDLWQEATLTMPLHGGCSFLEWKEHDKQITSIQVGADYNHLHDRDYTFFATKEEAVSVFIDAEELIEWLERRGEE